MRNHNKQLVEQYLKATHMASAELGVVINKPTERIKKNLGNAIAHRVKEKEARAAAQNEFQANIAYFYEVKQRLLSPGYRADVDGGKDRTPDDNQRYFGAPDWASFIANCAAYSLQHADRKLRAFAKANGLAYDGETENGNTDDSGSGVTEAGQETSSESKRRHNGDLTAHQKYESVATAAMDIAKRNPEGAVEKQILAAAEHEPAPLMPLPPDVYTDVLSFITMISSSATDDGIRADAKRLIGKMLLHRPLPDASKSLAEASEVEKRQRNERLAKANGQPLGSAGYLPNQTSEHVQRFDVPVIEEESHAVPSAEPELQPIAQHSQEPGLDAVALVANASVSGTGQREAHAEAANSEAPVPSGPSSKVHKKSPVSVKVTKCPPAHAVEGYGSCERKLPEANGYKPSAITKEGYVSNKDGKWEYVGKKGAAA